MPFDGIVTRSVVHELSGLIKGGRIEKIFQTGADEITLLCHTQAGHFRLLISADAGCARIHLTQTKKENPAIAPPFSMVLRKYIQSGRILDVRQDGFDRIVTFDIESRSDMGDVECKHLIVEIMGRHSNIILTNEAGVIHDAIKHIDEAVSRFREVMPARHYVAPPKQDKLSPDNITREALCEAFDRCKELDVTSALLSSLSGFSPLLCNSICYDCDIRPKAMLNSLAESDYQRLIDTVTQLCDDIRDNDFIPVIIGDDKDYHCTHITASQYPSIRKYNTINHMLDDFYNRRDELAAFSNHMTSVQKLLANALDRCTRKLAIHREVILQNENCEKFRIYGELITSNLYKLPEYAEEVTVEDYYDEYKPVTIKLNGSKTVSRNAQDFFQKYRKSKSAYDNAVELQNADTYEINYLENVKVMLANAVSVNDIEEIRAELNDEGFVREQQRGHGRSSDQGDNAKKPLTAFMGGKPASKKSLRMRAEKAKARGKAANAANGTSSSEAKQSSTMSKPYSFTTGSGIRILVGKNNRQNDKLTLRDAKPDDLWFHLRNAPGSHVILCVNEHHAPVIDADIEKAAALAAWYSSAKNTSKADVDYTEVKHVRKIPGAHPGMVTYSNFKTITVRPQPSVD